MIQLYSSWACTQRTAYPTAEVLTCSWVVTPSTTARKWKQTRCSSPNEWKMKILYICIIKYTEKWKDDVCKEIDGARSNHSEWIQKDKRHMFFLTYGCWLWVFRFEYLNFRAHRSQKSSKGPWVPRGREIEWSCTMEEWAIKEQERLVRLGWGSSVEETGKGKPH